jgi:hypothetical protein
LTFWLSVVVAAVAITVVAAARAVVCRVKQELLYLAR